MPTRLYTLKLVVGVDHALDALDVPFPLLVVAVLDDRHVAEIMAPFVVHDEAAVHIPELLDDIGIIHIGPPFVIVQRVEVDGRGHPWVGFLAVDGNHLVRVDGTELRVGIIVVHVQDLERAAEARLVTPEPDILRLLTIALEHGFKPVLQLLLVVWILVGDVPFLEHETDDALDQLPPEGDRHLVLQIRLEDRRVFAQVIGKLYADVGVPRLLDGDCFQYLRLRHASRKIEMVLPDHILSPLLGFPPLPIPLPLNNPGPTPPWDSLASTA